LLQSLLYLLFPMSNTRYNYL